MSARQSRATLYKNAGHGVTDLRRKRAELSVSLRKEARVDQLLKRRALSPDGGDEVQQDTEVVFTPAEIVEGLKSSDVERKLTAARAARRMLSKEQNPPISLMINAGIIRPLIKILTRDDYQDLLFEAAWALTNIASGTHEHTMAVIDAHAIPALVSLLGRGGVVGEQCVWALGNIAGDGAEPRDAVLEGGALPAILPMLAPDSPTSQLKTAVWSLSNFCRNKNPLVKFELIAPALPYISDLLEVADQDVLTDACWAISYLTDGPNERIEAVQSTKHLLPRIVKLLDHNSAAVKTPALRAVGNMLTGSDVQTERCLEAGCLQYISRLLRSGRPSLVKEAAWAASNVLAGTQHQIQYAIERGVLEPLVHVLRVDDIKCQKEAAWCMANVCMGGTPAQIEALMQANFLEPFTQLLDALDYRAVNIVLDGITHLLQTAAKFDQVEALCMRLEEVGALDKLESLQSHENEQIYTKVLHLLDTYFMDQEDQNTQPEESKEEFQFGVNQPQNFNF